MRLMTSQVEVKGKEVGRILLNTSAERSPIQAAVENSA
jgi:hypothetical protein